MKCLNCPTELEKYNDEILGCPNCGRCYRTFAASEMGTGLERLEGEHYIRVDNGRIETAPTDKGYSNRFFLLLLLYPPV